jgi:MFS family permease
MTNEIEEPAETMTETAIPQRVDAGAVARGRWAVTTVFFLNGMLLSTYTVRLPSLKADLSLSDGQLGVILTVFGAAALLTMQFVGPLVGRFGSARIMRLALVVLPVMLCGVGLAGNVVLLGAAVVLMGMVHGTLDVSMNAHAVAVERLRDRPVLNGCHAAWSLGAVVAASVGAGLTKAGVRPTEHFLWVAAILLIAGVAVGCWLLPASADRGTDTKRADKREAGWRTGWTRPVLVFGAMGFIVMVLEAAVTSWSGVFLHDSRGATLATAAMGYTAFTGCQTAGRLIGDKLHERFGGPALFRVNGLIAVAGLAGVLFIPAQLSGIVGFAVLGLGESVLLPLIFGAVGHAGGTGAGAATFLSRFTTFTYAGLLIGPALIGWFAQAASLMWTLAGLLPLLVVVVSNARVMAIGEERRAPKTAAEA